MNYDIGIEYGTHNRPLSEEQNDSDHCISGKEKSESYTVQFDEDGKIVSPCIIHSDKVILMYCEDCKVPCCVKCMEELHLRHVFIAIEKKYMAAKERLEEFMKGLKQTMPVMQTNIAVLKEAFDLYDKEFDDAEEEMEKYKHEVHDAVEKKFDDSIAQLEGKREDNHTKLTTSIKDVERQLTKVKALISECERAVRKTGFDIIEYKPEPLPPHVHKIPELSLAHPVVTRNANVADDLGKKLETVIFVAKTDPRLQTVAKKDKHRVRDLTNDAKMITSFEADICGGSVVPTDFDTSWVTCWDSDTMYQYDVEGHKVNSITVKNDVNIWGIAINSDGDIVVANTDMMVRLVTTKGKVTDLIDTQPFSPQGVCLTDKEEVVVCMAGHGESDHIAIYSPDGKNKICQIVNMTVFGKSPLTDPYKVLTNGDNFTVLNHRQSVVTLDRCCRVIWIYEGKETKVNQTFDPWGICKDDLTNFLISDSKNHCIHYINSDGGLLQLFPLPENDTMCPWGIGVDRGTQRLWLGTSASKRIWVLRYA